MIRPLLGRCVVRFEIRQIENRLTFNPIFYGDLVTKLDHPL